MYTLAIAYADQPPTTRFAADASDLHSLVRSVFYADDRQPTATDHAVIARAVGEATALVENGKVAVLNLGGGTTVTVNPLAA